jgi:UDP-3-O-[3-hydroxymyristoyl] glucosamine N-acyltransferase
LKLQDIAERLHCRLEGDGSVEILRVAGVDRAAPGDLTFIANSKYIGHLAGTRASAVIVGASLPVHVRPPTACAVLRAENPYVAFAHAVSLFVQTSAPARGVDRLSAVSPDATLGTDVCIGPFVVVGPGAVIGARSVIYPSVVIGRGVTIGEDCVVHSHVSIRDRVVVGHRVTLHDGVVLGSDGFGFAKQADGTHLKIPQLADVVVEDDVEIGAHTAIDRPAIGETRIQAGAKIDNLVHIAHGVRIGARALLAAQVGIAGSSVIEDDVMLGGQVGVPDHVRIARGAMASAKTGITGNVEPGVLMSGYPMQPNLDWRKSQVLVRHLPELKKRIEELEQRVAELTEKLAACLPSPDH